MANIDDTLKDLSKNLVSLAESSFQNAKKEAKKDLVEFYEKSEKELKKWGQQLIEGEIDKDSLESLVNGRKDLLKMKTLELAGESLIKIDQFKNQVFELILGSLKSLIN